MQTPSRHHLLAALFTLGMAASAFAQPQKTPDFTQFAVMGEGLAAGFADFQLKQVDQVNSFPALIAQQAGALFPQPLIQTPGIGYAPGFPILPVRVPNTLQTTVRVAAGPVPVRADGDGQPPQDVFIFNTSIPNQKIADALTRAAGLPLIQQTDLQQTTINFILGFPQLVAEPNEQGWTQLQYMQELNPTFVILALGYSDILPAAVAGDLTQLPNMTAFHTNYASVLAGLRATFAPILIVNVPDPTDTAYFSTLTAASNLLLASPATLQTLYGLHSDDQITLPGLFAIGTQLAGNQVGPLPAGSVVSAATIAAIKASVTAINTEIATQAQGIKAPLYDARTRFSNLRATGYTTAAGLALTANVQGGLYSLCGYYPGSTIHAIMANDILNLINKTYGSSYPLLSVDTVAATDPTVRVFSNSAVRVTKKGAR